MNTHTDPDTTYGTPCIVCGAPIRLGIGHDEGCSAEQRPFTPRWIARLTARDETARISGGTY